MPALFRHIAAYLRVWALAIVFVQGGFVALAASETSLNGVQYGYALPALHEYRKRGTCVWYAGTNRCPTEIVTLLERQEADFWSNAWTESHPLFWIITGTVGVFAITDKRVTVTARHSTVWRL